MKKETNDPPYGVPALIHYLSLLAPPSFVSVFLTAVNRMKKADRLEIMRLLMERQYQALADSKEPEEIMCEVYFDKDNPPPAGDEKKMRRCESIHIRLGSRCMNGAGHHGKHLYPNAILKREDPELFEKLNAWQGPVPLDITSELREANKTARSQLDKK